MLVDVHGVLVTDTKAQQVHIILSDGLLVHHGFGCSECLADKGSNPLATLSCLFRLTRSSVTSCTS